MKEDMVLLSSSDNKDVLAAEGFVKQFYTALFEREQNSERLIREKPELFTPEFLEAYDKEMKRYKKASYVLNPDGTQRIGPDGAPEREVPDTGLNYDPFTWSQEMLEKREDVNVKAVRGYPDKQDEMVVEIEIKLGNDKRTAYIFLMGRLPRLPDSGRRVWQLANAQLKGDKDLMTQFQEWSKTPDTALKN